MTPRGSCRCQELAPQGARRQRTRSVPRWDGVTLHRRDGDTVLPEPCHIPAGARGDGARHKCAESTENCHLHYHACATCAPRGGVTPKSRRPPGAPFDSHCIDFRSARVERGCVKRTTECLRNRQRRRSSQRIRRAPRSHTTPRRRTPLLSDPRKPHGVSTPRRYSQSAPVHTLHELRRLRPHWNY
jgi:hypothetical protein